MIGVFVVKVFFDCFVLSIEVKNDFEVGKVVVIVGGFGIGKLSLVKWVLFDVWIKGVDVNEVEMNIYMILCNFIFDDVDFFNLVDVVKVVEGYYVELYCVIVMVRFWEKLVLMFVGIELE